MTVSDVPKALGFYRDALGLPFLFSPSDTLAFLQAGDVRVMLSTPQGAGKAGGNSILYFRVESIEQAYAAVVARGATGERAPQLAAKMPDHDLWLAFLRDPDGNLIGLMEEMRAWRAPAIRIEVDDPAAPDVRALLEEHLRSMHQLSPPESVHALDVESLKRPDVTFWTVRDGVRLLGCGALKQLDPSHGEIKSMRTPAANRRQGAGRAVLEHVIAVARERGYRRLSLETGTNEAFVPAQTLYRSFGFEPCEPFGDYRPDPHSAFMTLRL